jgi:hypothetical protein
MWRGGEGLSVEGKFLIEVDKVLGGKVEIEILRNFDERVCD